MTVMFDSVDVSTVPPNAEAVAGYVGGSFPDFSELVAAFPKAHHLGIAVSASEDAECLDVENGDANPSDAPAWLRRQQARGVKRPVVYADLSTMPVVKSQLTAAGIKRSEYRTWVAHFTGVAHLEDNDDACQWTDTAFGRNLDESLCTADFFKDSPAPASKNATNYTRFPNEDFGFNHNLLRLNERNIVMEYDRLRKLMLPHRKPVKARARLYVLRAYLRMLAGRVYRVSHDQKFAGRPSWGKFYRGWRYQQLIHRAQGQRFI